MGKKLLYIFAFIYCHCWGQGNMITINTTVPNQLTVCGPAKTFTIAIYNPSPFLLTNDTLRLTLPSGIVYQPGSITGAGVTQFNISTPNQPVFLLPSIPTLSSLNITFTAAATCDVLAYLSGGGIIQNNVLIKYLANGSNTYDDHTTSSYIVRQPNLSISNFTNQSYTGAIGDTYQRCITVTNGGFGELSQFTLTDVHGSGLQITAVSKGTWVSAGNTETVTLNGTHFSTIGDGDNLFENGESIIICETVNIVNCISVSSAIEAYWGCNTQHCQSSTSNANVVFPNLIPNLVFTPTPSMNSCIGPGNASLQQLKIVNNGMGKAMNVVLDIFQSTGTGYNANVASNIDPASFTIKTGLLSTPVTITPTSTQVVAQSAALLACMAPNQIGKVALNIPQINAGDTVYITWNTYSCCHNSCTNVGQSYINGWRYKGTYQNVCQSTYVVAESWGRTYANIYADLTNNSSPPTLSDGQTGTFNYLFSNYGNSYPVGPGAYWKFEFTLPNCLVYAGGLSILRSNGIHTWLPSSVTTSGNVVTAIFNGNPPWNLVQAELKIDLTANCAGCGGVGGASSVSVKSYFVPNNTCGCQVGISCQSTAISISCPGSCPEGMLFKVFELKRTSYGLPDNEAGGGNGIPDGGGALDFTKIRTDRAMFGDTITSSFNGVVKTSLAHPSWQYCYAYSSITNGNRFTFQSASLKIYRAGALVASCDSITPTVTNSGSTRNFKYNLSVPSNPCLATYTYMNDDSVVFKPIYKVTSNTGGSILTCNSSNEYYLSDILNPTLPADKFQCNTINGSCAVMGYFFNNENNNNYTVKSCDNVIITQNYYLSIGPSNNNYAGGNMFPYEYRNWAHIHTLTAIIPYGYDYVSAQFNYIRTSGTLATTTHPTPPAFQNISPVDPNSDTLKFLVESFFQGYGGTMPLSDDGFHGTLQVTIRPSCEVTPTISQSIKYDWLFAITPNNYLTGPGSASTTISRTHDSIIYEPPFLFLQSTLPAINAPNLLGSWEVSISNLSNTSNALNTWLGAPVMSGITITEVYDLNNNVVINSVGEIYQVGTVNAGATRSFRITADFTSCLKDSIIIYSGWNCNAGYPATVQAYPCSPKSITLSLTPLLPALVVNVTGPPGTIQLCDTASYTIEGVNVQLGTAYNTSLTAILPPGVTIIPGTTQMSYPIVNPYVFISDPVFGGGTTWKWNISAIDSTIGADGLKGILIPSLNSFRLTFQVVTSCGYTSGSAIAFNLQGEAACGMPTGQEVALSSQLGITGATPPYTTAIRLLTTYISPCANTSSMHVVVGNLGPMAFSTTDSIYVQLPAGVSYVPGSFTGIHNQPLTGVPVQYTLNGSEYLGWKLPTGVVAGDSTVFNFGYQGDPSALSCAISEFEARTTSSTNVLCTQSGTNCGINIATGDTTLSVFTYKAYLSLSNGNSSSVQNAPSGETVSVSFDIANTGEAISNGANSILQFYYDSNGNGSYDAGDAFITQDTIQVTNNSVMPYSNTFNVAAGNACSIIATVRNAVNPCVCNPSQLLLTPELKILGNDSTVCSGSPVTLGPAAVTGYTYSWSPITGLSSANVCNPVLTTTNSGSSPVTTPYIVTITRMGCTTQDTIAITVNPLPISNAGADIAVCPAFTPGNIGAASTAGYTYSWSPATGLSNAAISDPTVDQSATDTTTYIVTTTVFGCISYDSVLVRINPLPTATISGTTAVCKGAPSPNITFTGAGATAPYTFTYTINGGSNQTVTTTSGNSVTVSVPTSAVDTLTYALVSVQESSSTGCSQNQSGTAVVQINPLPTATISGSTAVCQGSASPNITFKGANATAPYTFTYTIDGGSQLTVTTSTSDSVTVSVPTTSPGTFVYELIGVQESSNTTCPQLQSGIATIVVNPSPTAAITNSIAMVCKDAISPTVTFTGATGTAPYTFTYTLNNGIPQTITTSGNSVTIPVPTTMADTLIYKLVSIQDSSTTACIQSLLDSTVVIVKPLPTATVTGTTAVCKDDSPAEIIFTGANGIAPYTFTYVVNNGAPQTISTISGNSVSSLVSTGTAGIYTYKLISVKEGSVEACEQLQSDSAIITVNPLPTGTVSGTATVCKDAASPLITFTGADGTPPYTFTYAVNSGIPQTITTITGDTVSIAVPTSTAGALTYILSNVQDSSPSVCSQNQNSSATITIKSLPEGIVSGTTEVCKDGAAPIITFTGSGGTAPYIFTYAIDSVIQPSLTSIGNSATVSVPTAVAGVFTYSLVSLQESSANQCSQLQTESAEITVNPLPTGFVSGTTEVCTKGTPPQITFTGANGTTPYTFTYKVDNGSPQTVSSTIGNSSATVAVPTNVPDTLVYWLISVTDGSVTACSQAQSDSATIIVNPLPLALFSPTEVCYNTPVQFTDLSTVSSGSVTGWDWDFGQEGFSTLQNPFFTYIGFGNYVAKLVVTTENGCTDTASTLVVVHPLPSPEFYAASVCDGSTMQFNEMSTIPSSDTLQSWSWNFGDNTTGNQQETTHIYPAAGSYPAELISTSTFGCKDSITHTVTVHPNPEIALSAADTIGCEPLCVLFQDVSQIQSGSITGWLWDTGDGSPISTASEFEHCYSNDQVTAVNSYNVVFTAVSDSGCNSVLSKPNFITVYPKPEAGFVVHPITTTILDPVITVSDSSQGASSWSWDFGDQFTASTRNPTAHEYADTGHYTITQIVTSTYGCMDTATELVIVEPDFAFFVPNAFTPDGDGINDSFIGKGVFIIEFEMWIYDRWGDMVYYTADINQPWDGKANNGAEMAQRDVYVYVIRLKDIKSNEHKYRGDVTLVR